MSAELVASAQLTRQSFGIAMAQVSYGGPRGIWLNCKTCPQSQVIVGSNSEAWEAISSEDAAQVFIRHGWKGEGPLLMRARCPKCAEVGK